MIGDEGLEIGDWGLEMSARRVRCIQQALNLQLIPHPSQLIPH
jgi:hypothetical protein